MKVWSKCDTTVLCRVDTKRITFSIPDISWKRVLVSQSQSNQIVSGIFNLLFTRENFFSTSFNQNQTEKSFGCRRRTSSFWDFTKVTFTSHTRNEIAANFSRTSILVCLPKQCVALSIYQLWLRKRLWFCFIDCDCVLPVRKIFFLAFTDLLVFKVENHCFKLPYIITTA